MHQGVLLAALSGLVDCKHDERHGIPIGFAIRIRHYYFSISRTSMLGTACDGGQCNLKGHTAA